MDFNVFIFIHLHQSINLKYTFFFFIKLKDDGKIRFIGITGLPLRVLKEVLEQSGVKIDTVLSYCHYSLNDTSLLDYIPFFQVSQV